MFGNTPPAVWTLLERRQSMNWNRWTVVLTIVLALMAADAFAQRGAVRGKIVDEQGNPVEDVEIIIQLSGGGGRKSTTETNEKGEFVKAGIKPGTYEIRYEKEGYRPLALGTQVGGFDQSDMGERVLYKLAPGELSESQHARATELLESVNSAAASGDDAAILQGLLEFIEMVPDSAEAHFNVGGAYEKQGDDDEAIEYYKKATELQSDFYDAWVALGDLYGERKDWAEGQAALGKALEIKSDNVIVVFNHAVHAQNAGDAEAARAGYEKVIQMDPARAAPYYQLGLMSVADTDNDKALMYFEKYLEVEPNGPQAAQAQGVVDALKAAAERDPSQKQ